MFTITWKTSYTSLCTNVHHVGQRNYSEYRTLCRHPNTQLRASLWQAFFGIIVSSFILALSSFCLDCNASETMNSCLHVAPLNVTVSLIQTPEVHFWRGRGEIHRTGSITPFLKESFLCKSDYLPLQCLLYWRRYSLYGREKKTINMQNIWHTPDRSIFILELLDLTLLIIHNKSISLMTASH